ncbi:MAG: alpha/beta fold hydrolase [Elioraea sp.]|nr:alpha/beta fold hydrolase [Elioraea sp.]
MTRVRLHTIESGEGPPVVVLHGLFGSARNWGSIARRLAAGGRRVIAADLRNHGDSPHEAHMDYAAMADDVAGLIEELAAGRAAVLGHSMGGKVAMVLALTRPALVDRLVVVDIAPVAYRTTSGACASGLRALPLRPGMRRVEADALLSATVPDAAERAFLLQNLVFDDGGAPRWKPNLAAIEEAMPLIASFPEFPRHARFDGPVLVVRGERSGYVRPDHFEATLALFPRAVFVTVPGAGHWVQAEAPEAFLRAVEPFLALPA